MAKYVALLRGINLGKRRIKMADLCRDFEAWGFNDVQTVLASGNAIFESDEKEQAKVRETIEKGFRADYGWEVPTCIRSQTEIMQLVNSDPFKDIQVTKDIRRYITFLADPADSDLELPYVSIEGDYCILDVQPGHVASVLNLSRGSGTLDAMEVLGQEFGEGITTRNWNTVLKIQAKLTADD